VNIPLSGATLPGPVTQIELELQIAGRLIRQNFPPTPNQRTTFTWDGKDAYGRTGPLASKYFYQVIQVP